VVNALFLQGVSKRFGGLYAVSDITMDVAHGERRALIGPNGAGKTTLFNVIAGDLPASGGEINLFGQNVTRMPVYRRVGLGLRRTYQKSALFDALTVAQNLYLGVLGPNRGHFDMLSLAQKDARRSPRVAEVAESVGLVDRLEACAGELSHGERRQLEFGLAIASEPRLVMLDEPMSGLSPEERVKIVKLLEALPRKVTLLLIEHDMDVALSVAKRVTVLHEGRVIAEGSPEEISANSLVQQVYLGEKLND
jgi:branched-chain amino acid transport system ATP-binding protein